MINYTGATDLAWSEEEDLLLFALVHKFSIKSWNQISAQFNSRQLGTSTRSVASCRNRWVTQLQTKDYQGQWTALHEEAFILAHKLFGNKWSEVANYLPGFPPTFVKNHFYSKVRTMIPKLKQLTFIKELTTTGKRQIYLYYLRYSLDALRVMDTLNNLWDDSERPKRMQDKFLVEQMKKHRISTSHIEHAIKSINSLDDGRLHQNHVPHTIKIPKKYAKSSMQQPVFTHSREGETDGARLAELKIQLLRKASPDPLIHLAKFKNLFQRAIHDPQMNADNVISDYRKFLAEAASAHEPNHPDKFLGKRSAPQISPSCSPRLKIILNFDSSTQAQGTKPDLPQEETVNVNDQAKQRTPASGLETPSSLTLNLSGRRLAEIRQISNFWPSNYHSDLGSPKVCQEPNSVQLERLLLPLPSHHFLGADQRNDKQRQPYMTSEDRNQFIQFLGWQ